MKRELDADELNLVKLASEYSEPEKARKLLESLRWANGPVCPHCTNDGQGKPIYTLESKADSKRPGRAGLYKCGACRKQFTVTVGTIFQDSHIAISKWLMAIFILCSSKKAISAHQLHRMLGITYKSAWFMAHRIRFALLPNNYAEPKLGGTVELDETFVGGKGDRTNKSRRQTPVVALIERDERARTQVVAPQSRKRISVGP